MQADFLRELLRQCRAREIHTAVDTSGHAEPQVVERIAGYGDLFLCDIKHMDSGEHERLTGVGNEIILANIRRLAEAGRNVIMRLPIVPGFNDGEQNIATTGKFATALGGISRIDLLPCNRGGRQKSARLTGGHELIDVASPGDDQLAAVAERLRDLGFTVRIGG